MKLPRHTHKGKFFQLQNALEKENQLTSKVYDQNISQNIHILNTNRLNKCRHQ